MAIYNQLPGHLDIKVYKGDDLDFTMNFGIDISSYTLASTINSSTENAFAITVTDSTAGEIQLSLNDTQTTLLGTGTHKYEIDWTIGAYTRTIVNGGLIIL